MRNDHFQLCNSAYDFRKLEAMHHLDHQCQNESAKTHWYYIRHYIGRLSSWRKATRKLARVAAWSPRLLRNFQIQPLQHRDSFIAPLGDRCPTLQQILWEVYPHIDLARMEQALQSISQSRSKHVSKEFLDKIRHPRFRPQVHAEIRLAEHFYHCGLTFVGNDRYIGCSKPSCYCCELYLRHHPGQFKPRPCHGNIWIKWAPPHLLLEKDSFASYHVHEILKFMVERLCDHVREKLVLGYRYSAWLPDSETGLSTSLAPST